MVYQPRLLDQTFAALADPTRRAILARLATGECTIGDLAKPLPMSLPAVSKHLRVLQRAGLATVRREGRVRQCRLTAEPLRHAGEWIARYREYWEIHLDRLAHYLGEATLDEESPSWPTVVHRNRRPRSRLQSAAASPRRPTASSGRGRRPKS
jgi:DNA-binding transcriptional ArsR family regulator